MQGRAGVSRAGAEDRLQGLQARLPHRGRHSRHAGRRSEAARDVTPPRLLVIQTAYLGDTVFTSALIQSLRRKWPAAEIDLCVAPRGRDIARAIPGVSFVHVFDKRGADKG